MSAAQKKTKMSNDESPALVDAFSEIERMMNAVVDVIEVKSQQLETCAAGFDCDLSMVRKSRSDGAKVVPIHAKVRR
jgi:hypothetical protein